MLAGVDLHEPSVELVLEVALVGEHATRLEVGLHEALQPLDRALGLRVTRPAEMPADPQLPAERSELLARAPVVAVDAGLAVPDQRVGQAAELPQAATDTGQQVELLLGEHQRAGAGTRVAKARHDHPRRAPLANTLAAGAGDCRVRRLV